MALDVASRFERIGRVATSRPLSDYLAGRFFAMVGAWTFRVTVGWIVWTMTQSPAMVGLATAAMLGPQVLLGPISGVLADNRDRRRLLAVTHVFNGAAKILAGVCILAGVIGVPGLFLFILAAGVTGALSQASAKTIVSTMVEEHDLAAAISLNSVLFNLAGFIGPALAGLIIHWVSPGFGLIVAGCLALVFVVTLRRVPPIPPSRRKRGGFFAELKDGLTYAAKDPFIRLLMVLHAASATLARPFMDFIPSFVTTFFSGGAGAVALVVSTVGAGSVAGGLWLAQRDNSRGVLPVVLGAFIALSLVLIAFAWSRSLYLAVPLAFVAGFGMILRAAGLQTIMQTETAEELRGRVMSFYGMILNGGAILGALLIGVVAEKTSLPTAMTLSVCGALAIWALVRNRLTQLAADRRTRTSHQSPPEAELNPERTP
jgi:MFS family permease